MKKYLAFLLALLMALSLVACGGVAEKEQNGDNPVSLPNENGNTQIGTENKEPDQEEESVGSDENTGSETPDTDSPATDLSYDATYFAIYNTKFGRDPFSFQSVIKDRQAVVDFMTQTKVESGDYSVFFEPYNSAFFDEHVLVALYFSEMLGAYPVVDGCAKKDQKLHLTVATVCEQGYQVNGKHGVMILLSLDKDAAIEDLTVDFTSRSTADKTEYNAACDLYKRGPMPMGEALDFTVAKSIGVRAEDVKGYTCSVDEALVLDSAEAFANFERQNVDFGEYDEAFFETKALVLVFARPVSSTQIPFTAVTDFYGITDEDGNKAFRMTVKYDVQQIGTDDLTWLCYIVEVDADAELANAGVQTSHVYIHTWRP